MICIRRSIIWRTEVKIEPQRRKGRRSMRTRFELGWATAFSIVAAALAAGPLCAADANGTGNLLSARAAATAQSVPADQVIRVIEDRSVGNHWLLCRNPEHPAGPRRLLLLTPPSSRGGQAKKHPSPTAFQVARPSAPVPPMIRSGDLLIVEENTSVAEVRLAGVALESATAGGVLRVRLEMDARVIRAVAVAPNRALLAPQTEVEP